MQRTEDPVVETYREIEAVISNLVECYAIPHTRMCMRWTHPSRDDYRSEVVGWLEDYAKSFRRLPTITISGRAPLPAFARACLEREIRPILEGRNAAVEESYDQLFR